MSEKSPGEEQGRKKKLAAAFLNKYEEYFLEEIKRLRGNHRDRDLDNDNPAIRLSKFLELLHEIAEPEGDATLNNDQKICMRACFDSCNKLLFQSQSLQMEVKKRVNPKWIERAYRNHITRTEGYENKDRDLTHNDKEKMGEVQARYQEEKQELEISSMYYIALQSDLIHLLKKFGVNTRAYPRQDGFEMSL